MRQLVPHREGAVFNRSFIWSCLRSAREHLVRDWYAILSADYSPRKRFAPLNHTKLFRIQLKDKHQGVSKNLLELGQAIRGLTCFVYPSAIVEVRETLRKELSY